MRFLMSLSVLIAVFSGLSTADVINVPSDQPTIQQAVDAAVDGDEIVVAPGTYNEQINLRGKRITIRSVDPDDPATVSATVVDGGNDRTLPGFPQREGPVFRANSGETTDTRLVGLTITGGAANDPSMGSNAMSGGGVQAFIGSTITVDRCAFLNNWSSGAGGALYVAFSDSPIINECTFIGNETAGLGGAVSIRLGVVEFASCIFRDNVAALDGGAVYAGGTGSAAESVTYTNCVFERNTTTERSGGAVASVNKDATFIDCEFRENSADLGRGGAISHSNGMLTVTGTGRTPFVANSAGDSGGAISMSGDQRVLLERIDFLENGSVDGGGALSMFRADATITGCDFVENESGDDGGAAELLGVDATYEVLDSSFEGNSAGGEGGAIAVFGASARIEDCLVVGNNATRSGGIALSNARRPTVVLRTQIADNTATSFYGGISVTGNPIPPFNTEAIVAIEDCKITRNTAGMDGGGIGVFTAQFTEIRNSVISYNTAGESGGGARVQGQEDFGFAVPATFINTLFHANSAENGGAVYAFATDDRFVGCVFSLNTATVAGGIASICANVTMNNCTAWLNAATSGGFAYTECTNPPFVTLRIRNSIWFENSATTGSAALIDRNSILDIGSTLVDQTSDLVTLRSGMLAEQPGLITGNPLFVNAIGADGNPLTPDDNDLGLSAGSPAIDAGDNSEVPAALASDFLDMPRFVDDPGAPDSGVGAAPLVDLGALERQPIPSGCLADFNDDGLLNFFDVISFISAYTAGDSSTDLAKPFGVLNFFDISAYIALFVQGCP